MNEKHQPDIISTLPQNIIDNILSLMPIRDAVRTSILSKKWQYCWQSMPKLVFTDNMVTVPFNRTYKLLMKYKLASAIFHVLSLHNRPEILEFDSLIDRFHMESEFAQIIRYLGRGNKVKQLYLLYDYRFAKLPVSFFALQGCLELVHLRNCTFEPPSTFNKFSRLKRLALVNVEVSAQTLQRFLPMCPLLEYLTLDGYQNLVDFVAGENKFTFVDLLRCVPLIKSLNTSMYYVKYLSAGGMPHKLPATLANFKYLISDVCLVEQNVISSTLCMIRSSPLLVEIIVMMYDNDKLPVQQTPANFLDPESYPDLKLDHLERLEIQEFSNLPLEMEFMKLIMAKSPVLKKVQIKLDGNVSNDDELTMLRDLVLLPFPRASPCAKLTIVRPENF